MMSQVQRIGMVIKVKPEKLELYKKMHADDYKGVRDLLSEYHMRNFSIFLHPLEDGQLYLFGTYEYAGEDYEADMAKLAVEPRNKEWLSVTDDCQIPLKGTTGWAIMEQVYYNE